MSYQQEVEGIHIEIKKLADLLESQNNSDETEVQYEYKIIPLGEEETGSNLEAALNFWSARGNWYYIESIYMDEQWVTILERKKSD